MKVVQTQLSDTEYSMLEAYARRNRTSIKETVRQAIRSLTLRDEVDPDDPIFKAFPLYRKKPRHMDASENVDRYLYGREE